MTPARTTGQSVYAVSNTNADDKKFLPLQVGDFIIYSGVKDNSGTLWAWALTSSITATTSGSTAYVAIDVRTLPFVLGLQFIQYTVVASSQ